MCGTPHAFVPHPLRNFGIIRISVANPETTPRRGQKDEGSTHAYPPLVEASEIQIMPGFALLHTFEDLLHAWAGPGQPGLYLLSGP